MAYNDDFSKLKVGDEIAIMANDGRYHYFPVEKIGSTWFRANDISFNKKYGQECGNKMNPRYAHIVTPGFRARVRFQEAHQYIDKTVRALDPYRTPIEDVPASFYEATKLLGWKE